MSADDSNSSVFKNRENSVFSSEDELIDTLRRNYRHNTVGGSNMPIFIENACALCFEAYSKNTCKPVLLKCGHGTCTNCNENIKKSPNPTCIICREELLEAAKNSPLDAAVDAVVVADAGDANAGDAGAVAVGDAGAVANADAGAVVGFADADDADAVAVNGAAAVDVVANADTAMVANADAAVVANADTAIVANADAAVVANANVDARSRANVGAIVGGGAVILVLLFDSTSSMKPYLNAIKSEMQKIVKNIKNKFPDAKFILIEYRDYDNISRYVTKSYALTDNLATMQNNINSVTINGGGDIPEALGSGLSKVCEALEECDIDKSQDSAIVIIVTDAPAHGLKDVEVVDTYPNGDPNGIDPLQEAYNITKLYGGIIYPICCGGELKTNALALFQSIAEVTGGQAINLKHANMLPDIICGAIIEEVEINNAMAQHSEQINTIIKTSNKEDAAKEIQALMPNVVIQTMRGVESISADPEIVRAFSNSDKLSNAMKEIEQISKSSECAPRAVSDTGGGATYTRKGATTYTGATAYTKKAATAYTDAIHPIGRVTSAQVPISIDHINRRIGSKRCEDADDRGVKAEGDRGIESEGDRGIESEGDRGAEDADDRGSEAEGDRGIEAEGDRGAEDADNRGVEAEGDRGGRI